MRPAAPAVRLLRLLCGRAARGRLAGCWLLAAGWAAGGRRGRNDRMLPWAPLNPPAPSNPPQIAVAILENVGLIPKKEKEEAAANGAAQ